MSIIISRIKLRCSSLLVTTPNNDARELIQLEMVRFARMAELVHPKSTMALVSSQQPHVEAAGCRCVHMACSRGRLAMQIGEKANAGSSHPHNSSGILNMAFKNFDDGFVFNTRIDRR